MKYVSDAPAELHEHIEQLGLSVIQSVRKVAELTDEVEECVRRAKVELAKQIVSESDAKLIDRKEMQTIMRDLVRAHRVLVGLVDIMNDAVGCFADTEGDDP